MEKNIKLQERINFQSKKRIDTLKKRTKRCRCKYCGGKLKLRRIIFSDFEEARIEIFCSHCDRIEYGVEPEIYQSALFFVENSGFNCYLDLDDNAKIKQMTIAKVCEIMAWQDQNFGIMDEHGFCVELKLNENFLGECITLSEANLEEDDDIEDKYVLE